MVVRLWGVLCFTGAVEFVNLMVAGPMRRGREKMFITGRSYGHTVADGWMRDRVYHCV